MADPLSMFAGCVAVAGLATKVAKSLDDLIGRWENASLSLESLRSLITTFSASLNTLSLWMEDELQNVNALTDLSFVQSLTLSCEGCLRFLLALKVELDLIGHSSAGKSRWGKKAVILWNENRIKDLRDHLMCQNQGLMLLLHCRQLSQEQRQIRCQQSSTEINDVRQDTKKLRQLDGYSLGKEPLGSLPRKDPSKIDLATIQHDLDGYKKYLVFFTEASNVEVDTTTQEVRVAKLSDAEKLRADYHEKTAKGLDFLVPECPKFRILVIGQTGAGKSTICSRTLGISLKEAGVSHRGIGTTARNVWREITGPRNKHLILHDAGGFQAGSNDEMNQVEEFIKSRKEEKLLKDQLHCIWYCISCEGRRNIQGVERYFLDKVDTGQIPVFFVFTKYDLLIEDFQKAWKERNSSSQKTLPQTFSIAEELAYEEYQDTLESEILRMATIKPRIKTCRVAIPIPKLLKGEESAFDYSKVKEYKLVKYNSDGEFTGLNDLTKAVADTLEEGLRIVWIAGQRNRADLKLKESWEGCINQYWRVQKVSRIPIVPLICMWTLGSAYDEILGKLTKIWGITTEPEGLLASRENLHFGFLSATFDASEEVLLMNSFALASYNLGPLAGSLTAKITLKMIVGLTLIFEQMFLTQQKQGGTPRPFTKEMILEESRKFKSSQGRRMMSDEIEKRIYLANCYKIAEAKTATREALRAGKSRDAERYSNF